MSRRLPRGAGNYNPSSFFLQKYADIAVAFSRLRPLLSILSALCLYYRFLNGGSVSLHVGLHLAIIACLCCFTQHILSKICRPMGRIGPCVGRCMFSHYLDLQYSYPLSPLLHPYSSQLLPLLLPISLCWLWCFFCALLINILATAISAYFWIKKDELPHHVGVTQKASQLQARGKSCDLYLTEKLLIMKNKYPRSLNVRSELLNVSPLPKVQAGLG